MIIFVASLAIIVGVATIAGLCYLLYGLFVHGEFDFELLCIVLPGILLSAMLTFGAAAMKRWGSGIFLAFRQRK